MRATEVGVLFAWSSNRRQLFYCSEFLRFPLSLFLPVLLMLFIGTTISGVDGEIGSKYLNCCGMPLNTSSKCWTEAACVCEDCVNRTQDALYRLEFCSSFPLNGVLKDAFLWNRTFCQEQLNILRGADNAAYGNYKNFEGIIQLIDCGENLETRTYSAASTCFDCLEAYKNWICFTKISEAIASIEYPDKTTEIKRKPCLPLCETVLQKCPYLPPVPNDDDNLVQVGYSAFNCLDTNEWMQEHRDYDHCLHYDDPMVKCKQNNYTSIPQSTVTTMTVSASSNSTSNSTSVGGR